MNGKFIDTNVLVYFASADPTKALRAEALLRAGAAISVQVLNELTNVARRKLVLDWTETRELISLIIGLVEVLPLTLETHRTALRIAERYQLSFYDASIVASALLGNCDVVYSEDMRDGLVIDRTVRIVNPF